MSIKREELRKITVLFSLLKTILKFPIQLSKINIPESKTLRYLCGLLTCSKAIATVQI